MNNLHSIKRKLKSNRKKKKQKNRQRTAEKHTLFILVWLNYKYQLIKSFIVSYPQQIIISCVQRVSIVFDPNACCALLNDLISIYVNELTKIYR